MGDDLKKILLPYKNIKTIDQLEKEYSKISEELSKLNKDVEIIENLINLWDQKYLKKIIKKVLPDIFNHDVQEELEELEKRKKELKQIKKNIEIKLEKEKDQIFSNMILFNELEKIKDSSKGVGEQKRFLKECGLYQQNFKLPILFDGFMDGLNNIDSFLILLNFLTQENFTQSIVFATLYDNNISTIKESNIKGIRIFVLEEKIERLSNLVHIYEK